MRFRVWKMPRLSSGDETPWELAAAVAFPHARLVLGTCRQLFKVKIWNPRVNLAGERQHVPEHDLSPDSKDQRFPSESNSPASLNSFLFGLSFSARR